MRIGIENYTSELLSDRFGGEPFVIHNADGSTKTIQGHFVGYPDTNKYGIGSVKMAYTIINAIRAMVSFEERPFINYGTRITIRGLDRFVIAMSNDTDGMLNLTLSDDESQAPIET